LATATKSTGLSVAGKLDKVQPTPAYFLARSVTLTFDLLDPNSQPHWGASLHYITVFSAGPTTTRTGPAIQVYQTRFSSLNTFLCGKTNRNFANHVTVTSDQKSYPHRVPSLT